MVPGLARRNEFILWQIGLIFDCLSGIMLHKFVTCSGSNKKQKYPSGRWQWCNIFSLSVSTWLHLVCRRTEPWNLSKELVFFLLRDQNPKGWLRNVCWLECDWAWCSNCPSTSCLTRFIMIVVEHFSISNFAATMLHSSQQHQVQLIVNMLSDQAPQMWLQLIPLVYLRRNASSVLRLPWTSMKKSECLGQCEMDSAEMKIKCAPTVINDDTMLERSAIGIEVQGSAIIIAVDQNKSARPKHTMKTSKICEVILPPHWLKMRLLNS